MRRLPLLIVAALLWSGTAVAQSTPQEQAREKGREAIYQVDHGHFPQAIALFEEAMKLDPSSSVLAYEHAFAYYLQKDYKTAIRLGNKIKSRPDIDPLVYQMLGNSYDLTDNRKKALEMYHEGLKRFPNSGPLYTELGTMEMMAKNYNNALTYYEKGIEMDPTHASNYFRTAQLQLVLEQRVWGLIYGELYMLQEPKTDRAKLLSELMLDAYQKALTWKNDTSIDVNFTKYVIGVTGKGSKRQQVSALEASIKQLMKQMNFDKMYGTKMGQAFASEKATSPDALSRIRTRFLDAYFADSAHIKYPNLLFDYQRQVQQAGHLDAYNHWVLLQHDEATLDKWRHAHADAWNNFLAWFEQHPLEITAANHFYRAQYEQ